jgi:cytochrome c oxidase assembly factor CtaG
LDRIVTLIMVAGVFMIAAGAVGFVFARLNPQWSKETKGLVHTLCILAAVLSFALFAVTWIRSGS